MDGLWHNRVPYRQIYVNDGVYVFIRSGPGG